MSEEPVDLFAKLFAEFQKSMIESNGCVHDIEHYSEDGIMLLVCKKCDKSWVV